MAGEWDDILNQAEVLTNAQLDGEIAKLISLSSADIGRVAPTREDREHLIALMAVVRNARLNNDAKAQALQQSAELAGVAVRLIGALA